MTTYATEAVETVMLTRWLRRLEREAQQAIAAMEAAGESYQI